VIDIQHPTQGEEVGAAVVLKPGAEATPAELQAFCKERIAAYKIPEVRVAGAGAAEDGNREAAPPRGAAARRPVAVTTPTRAPADRRFTGPAWTSNVMDR
jgi:hypothetical protein